MGKEMPVIPVNKVCGPEKNNGGLRRRRRRRRGTRGPNFIPRGEVVPQG
jgi:hypothetical protein